MTAALIVAGGAGERMRRTGGRWPKPLAPILGVTLLERNVQGLLRAGLRDIHVAISAAADDIEAFVRSRCQKVAEALGAKLSVITENYPLGSIGAAAFLKDRQEVLVVNADNLTTLDLRAILARHRQSEAAMTLAIHDQPFPIPFGEVQLEADRVVAYREKPTFLVPICSAISVMGRNALDCLEPGENIGLPALVNRLMANGVEVRAFQHAAPWIDVNDLGAVEQAEALITERAEEFELWADVADRRAVAVMLSGDHGVVLERDDDGVWSFPSSETEGGLNVLSAVAHLIDSRIGVQTNAPVPLALLDDVDVKRGGVKRTQVFCADVISGAISSSASWVRPEEIGTLSNIEPVVRRALALKARK